MFQQIPLAYLQRQMMQILVGIPGIPGQMDDILVSGATQEEQDSRLKFLPDLVAAAGVTLNWNKCTYVQRCIKFLWFIIDTTGIRPDSEKIETYQRLTQIRLNMVVGQASTRCLNGYQETN